MQVEVAVGVRDGRVQQSAVVGRLFGDGVGQAAGGRLLAIEDVDDALPSFLAWKVGEYDGCDVGVFDKALDGADAGVVNYDLGVVALGGDVEYKIVLRK